MNSTVVQFTGAGPGAEDLITLRGASALEQADVVVYAGSLVNPAHLRRCRPDCETHDSASLHLEEQIDIMCRAALAGKNVVRLHTGDPAMYGAIAEQIKALADRGVRSSVVPGVSSVFGAAAALGCELTIPGVSQSVVLTRTPGRTPMPSGENAAAFARTGATLAFFLSAGHLSELADELTGQGGLSPDTPSAVVYRATWPDERIIRGTLADIAAKTEEAGIGRQALVFVGQALNADGQASLLYGEQFSHGYRNHLETERFSGSCALYAFTNKGFSRAQEIAVGLGRTDTVLFSTRQPEAVMPETSPHKAERAKSEGVRVVLMESGGLDTVLANNWQKFDAHIFVSATGIAVRTIAPLLRDKISDPAVLACSETGAHVISLTSGHLGGANRLARRVARITGGEAVISTATDLASLPAVDDIAAREQARVLDRDAIRILNAALLDGETVSFCGPTDIYQRHFAACPQVVLTMPNANAVDAITSRCAIFWDTPLPPALASHAVLRVASTSFVLGIGCRRGLAPEILQQTATDFLAQHGLHPAQLFRMASCDLKADEPAILALGAAWGVPVDFHARAVLDSIPVPTPSERVREKIGIGSVAEASAILSAHRVVCPAETALDTFDTSKAELSGLLCVPKTIHDGLTLALARIPHGVDDVDGVACTKRPSRSGRGRVVVVGLGSGSSGHLTPEVADALQHCDIVAGYTNYVDMVRERIAGKPLIQSGMMGEVERCRSSLEAATQGHEVCMVCSGDPGILAMAGLLYELRAREDGFTHVDIRVLPGITAANLAAASLGAPLQNGFSLISLSDLLVPADEVRRNLRAAAEGVLPVVLYNPAGRKRRHLLHEALDIFTSCRGEQTLCAFVRNAGRPQEEKWIGRLAEFPADEVDMSTVLVIGGPRTRWVNGVLYEARGYGEKYLD